MFKYSLINFILKYIIIYVLNYLGVPRNTVFILYIVNYNW